MILQLYILVDRRIFYSARQGIKEEERKKKVQLYCRIAGRIPSKGSKGKGKHTTGECSVVYDILWISCRRREELKS